ncbi:hypothetical protein SODALDRAFT_305599 [Sodiomyces alkalinus F11]|uniref:S5 DRBM domain-containing protein n=1 Tax=Sodiomyces alkalinus (strain CBS 110278 / VKM F-3762 / F11) TaxID=1314773 RepID=A0A3N2Q9T2_SODAK|nr:hypothetical protein SODALDRAFT_305599 [Sodiomyces alkalinus F11]ROT43502.1 hypothetical protein SODALDRAFT_305599 [Sodiomyces alkalinus F11]
MNAVRPARSVLSRCLRQSVSSAPAAGPSRSFQTSASRLKRRSRFRNIKAEEMGLTDPKKLESFATKTFPEYTDEEKAALRGKYTLEQYEAILAGEEAVDAKDLAIQGRLRDDPYRMPYLEDFSTIQPIIDSRPKTTAPPEEVKFLPHQEWVDAYIDKLADKAEVKMKDTIGKAVARALRRVKETNPSEIDFTEEELKDLENNAELRRKYIIEGENDEGYKAAEALAEAKSTPTPAGEKWWNQIDEEFYKELQEQLSLETNPLEGSKLDYWKKAHGDMNNSAVAPQLGKVEGVKGLYKPPVDPADEGLDDAGIYQEVKRLTGMAVKDIIAMPRKVLVRRYVHNQTRLGKIRSVSILVAAGNGDGRLGIGLAKSTDGDIARTTAELLAIRNMRPVRRYENRTIYGNVEAKVSGTVVQLRSRPPGFGLRVSHRIFEMARLAGIHDLSAKIPRSRNPLNTAKACYEALMNQPDPEQIAIGRGKKLVDVRKVYYGGAVY